MTTTQFIITKYALSTGIFRKCGEVCDTAEGRMIELGRGEYYHTPDWHLTVEGAVARVQVMREAALKSLRKKTVKLETMDIEAEVRATMVKPPSKVALAA